MGSGNDNGWPEWRNHVLLELERLGKKLDDHAHMDHQHYNRMIDEISALKVKAGVWGIMGGLFPAIGALIYFIIR